MNSVNNNNVEKDGEIEANVELNEKNNFIRQSVSGNDVKGKVTAGVTSKKKKEL